MNPGEFEGADLSLASSGRNDIQLALHEMPGLMAVRELFTKRDQYA
jgi:adenosylhomocysteinase